MRWLTSLMLVVFCLGMVALGAEVVAGSEVVADGYPLWIVILIAVIPVITTILERMGKKDILVKLKGAIEVGRTVFAAIEESDAKEAKKLVKEVVTGKNMSVAGKEINALLHSVTDVKAAEKALPIKRFWRRMLAGENLAGVAVRIAGRSAIANLLEKQE